MLGNKSGAGFRATAAPIATPVSEGQANTAFKQTQAGLSKQQQFLSALAAQNGIGNQSQVFSQLQGVANGTGPNPAMAQLNQATGQNIASQASLMAGQRGAGANIGLMARQAAQQGAGLQQQAVGQAATLQAQQQMGALGQMQDLATNQVGQQAGALAGYNQFAQGSQQNLLNAINAQNNAQVAMQSNQNTANVGIQQGNQKAQGGLLGGIGAIAGTAIGGPVGGALGSMAGKLMSDGGVVPGQAPVPGDSPANDIVPARLSPGEVVIPREVMSSPDPVAAAAHFVHQTLHQNKPQSGNFASGGLAGNIQTPQQAPLSEILAAQNGGQGLASQVQPVAMAQPMPVGEIPMGVAAPAQPMAVSDAINPSSMESGFQKQAQGLEKMAQAESKGAQAEAQVAGQAAKDLEALAQKTEAQVFDLEQERKRRVEDVANAKVDPDRYLASRSTGQRIGNAIGLILGGIGSGVTGQPNLAANFIQSQIDADIEAQKSELGKKENLLRQNMAQFGNLKDAQTMTKVNLMDIAALKMKQQAAAIRDPMAQARLLDEAGKLEVAAEQILGPIRFKRELLKSATPDMDPVRLVAIVPEKDRPKVIEEIEGAKNFGKSQATILKLFGKVDDQNKIFSKSSILGMPDAPSLAAWKAMGISALKAAGSGALSDNEAKLWESLAPQKGDSKADVELKRKGVVDFLEQKKAGMGSTAKAHGIDLSRFSSTSGAGKELTESKEVDRMRAIAEKNPNSAEAQAFFAKWGR